LCDYNRLRHCVHWVQVCCRRNTPCGPVCTCTHLYGPVHACMDLYTPVCTCTYPCGPVLTCMDLYMPVWTCTHLYAPVLTHVDLYLPVWACTYLCEHVLTCFCRLTLVWYHTTVRPFFALDGTNFSAGMCLLPAHISCLRSSLQWKACDQ